ncbi:hypothetical protein [Solidesulfovibrio sp.]|uniref:hypothetical protein n=1 Tax=Solidesulfovibrio sp. TaxID=2910990 RepID=UPI002634BBC2|nr:hypothetical protein [Solidesulfovibrio sp.]
MPPYLALWHRRFVALPPRRSLPVTLFFDRGAAPPLRRIIRAAWPADAREARSSALYVAALINNVLCVHGAASVTLFSENGVLAERLRDEAHRLLFMRLRPFSDMPFGFLRGLSRQVFGRDFRLEAAPGNAPAPGREPPVPMGTPPPAPRPGLVLAVNIGQHLTSLALVRVDGEGRFSLEGLTRRKSAPCGEEASLAAILAAVRDEARSLAREARPGIDALAISLAATTYRGKVLAVPGYGLFPEDCPAGEAATALARFCGDVAPGGPFDVLNDGLAQAVFAHRHGGAPVGDMLSVRLGSSPAVHRLDASGRAAPGFHEYGWLVTRFAPPNDTGRLFSSIRPYLSHYGAAAVAHELGLLGKYGLGIDEAPAFFRDALDADLPLLRQDAEHVYGILGAHLAMFAHELHRDRPLATIRLLGSRTSRLDAATFRVMAAGFAAFAAGHGLDLEALELTLIEEASAVAGLVGAAHVALEAAPQAGRG